jgi:hypothetical protein
VAAGHVLDALRGAALHDCINHQELPCTFLPHTRALRLQQPLDIPKPHSIVAAVMYLMHCADYQNHDAPYTFATPASLYPAAAPSSPFNINKPHVLDALRTASKLY